jgi:hypothetical protein
MAGGYFVTVDTPPYGVSSISHLNAESAAETATALLAEGRTIYVTTPDGDLVPGRDFLAEMAENLRG